MSGETTTYVLVDGENLDGVLGGSILARKPESDERPRWDRLMQFLTKHWGQPVTGLFFINATDWIPHSFVQAVQALGLKPVLLSGGANQKVVDLGIQKTLEALADRPGDLVLASHDGDFLPFVEPLIGSRRIAMAGFREFMNSNYRPWFEQGVEFLDLEYDMKLFNTRLPRTRVIPVDEFDPLEFL